MLSELTRGVAVRERRGAADVEVRAVTSDSRQAAPGVLFAAVPGTRVDGHRFIPQALAAGCSAVLLRDWPGEELPGDVAFLRVGDPRRALACAASRLHGDPGDAMRVFAVTGTNGKTTTVTILASILRAAGLKTGVLGTTGIAWDGPHGPVARDATHTTPDGPALFEVLGAMRDDGVQAVALELSSHALEQGRAAGLALDAAAWSNLSRDHLDYHGTMEAYGAAKALLLREWLPTWGKPGAAAVLNVDDPAVAAHAGDWARTLRVSCRPGAVGEGRAELAPAEPPTYSSSGTRARLDAPGGPLELELPLLGAHNLANALLAGACALAAGLPARAVEAGWAAVPGVRGRLEPVASPGGPLVLVDYAHTPDALDQVLAALRPATRGRLWVVFGCGGDRDRGKRPEMARAAAARADRVVLTSDNPRSESPAAILDEVEAGLPAADPDRFFRFEDRRRAIAFAVSRAAPDDLVVVAGKGHETTQTIGDRVLPFDDREVAAAALEARA